MGISVHEDGDITVVTPEGAYSIEELQSTVHETLDGQSAPLNLLFDLRKSLSLETRSNADIRSMGAFLKSIRPHLGPRFAMVTSGPLAYGLMRMGSALTEDDTFALQVFTELDDAQTWLRDGEWTGGDSS